jgi:phenylacetate-CoA ligase
MITELLRAGTQAALRGVPDFGGWPGRDSPNLLLSRVAGSVSAVRAIVAAFRRLSQEQWLPSEALAELRLARLRRVLTAANRAPYYRTAFAGAGIGDPAAVTLDDLARLPLLDRETMARHGLGAFLTVPAVDLIAVTTSGSTGTPGRFFRSHLEEAEYSARWMRVYRAYRCGARDAQINIATAAKPDRAGALAALRRLGVLPRVERFAASAPPADVLARVQALEPPILTGYAGAIESLADHVLATGAAVHRPRAVFCTAMEVTDRCLEVAARAFHAPAVDVYVTNEFGVLAWSCPVRRGALHVNDDRFIVEVLGPDGRPVPDGELGELVVTSLDLASMPLVRYRMGDMAARLPGRCECGRGLGLMTRLQGRPAHAIRRSDGGLVITPLVTNLFGRARAYEWVRRFQVREEHGGRLRVLLDARRAPTAEQRATLIDTLRSGLGPDFHIELEIVDRIPAAPSGKLQFLVPLAHG